MSGQGLDGTDGIGGTIGAGIPGAGTQAGTIVVPVGPDGTEMVGIAGMAVGIIRAGIMGGMAMDGTDHIMEISLTTIPMVHIGEAEMEVRQYPVLKVEQKDPDLKDLLPQMSQLKPLLQF
jgi:hypothetical protein